MQAERRARYTPVDAAHKVATINPYAMMIALAVTAVTKKLDGIEAVQQDIIEFLQLKEKAKLKGNVAVLQEILAEYRYNLDNEKYKNNKHIQVQEIKRDAEQSIILSRQQIEKKANRRKLLQGDKAVREKIEQIEKNFQDYELALYMFSFSSFLDRSITHVRAESIILQ